MKKRMRGGASVRSVGPESRVTCCGLSSAPGDLCKSTTRVFGAFSKKQGLSQVSNRGGESPRSTRACKALKPIRVVRKPIPVSLVEVSGRINLQVNSILLEACAPRTESG